MDKNAIEKWLKAEPFQPFIINLSNGESYEVHHPEMILVGKRQAVVYERDADSFSFVSMVHINSIKALQSV